MEGTLLGANIQIDVSGFHFENMLKPGLIEEIPGTRKLVTKLSTGEEIYKAKIRVFVQEGNNGKGIWKTLDGEKTLWPASWNDEKIWNTILEAYKNKKIARASRYEGITSDGIKVEMYLDKNLNINTAYIIE